jgi:hypothetical protein
MADHRSLPHPCDCPQQNDRSASWIVAWGTDRDARECSRTFHASEGDALDQVRELRTRPIPCCVAWITLLGPDGARVKQWRRSWVEVPELELEQPCGCAERLEELEQHAYDLAQSAEELHHRIVSRPRKDGEL